MGHTRFLRAKQIAASRGEAKKNRTPKKVAPPTFFDRFPKTPNLGLRTLPSPKAPNSGARTLPFPLLAASTDDLGKRRNKLNKQRRRRRKR